MATAVVSIFFAATLILAVASIYMSREAIEVGDLRAVPVDVTSSTINQQSLVTGLRHVASVNSYIIESKSVLFPEWTVFVIAGASDSVDHSNGGGGYDYKCVFQNNAASKAIYAGSLPVSNRRSFKCKMPNSVRSLRPLFYPVLTESEVNSTELAIDWTSRSHLARWTWLVYDSISTASDVILFAKAINHFGRVRAPASLRCVFTDEATNQQVRTPVTSSEQEVFRCGHPRLLEGSRISLTLEILGEGQHKRARLVPSVAVYISFQNRTDTSSLQSSSSASSSALCACTMVHNVGKFLKEWVMYHSGVGVDKFVLYDNDSDDVSDSDENFKTVVRELVEDGYKVETVFWPWPKAQEAGFSHSVISSKISCQWMMFMDVDEFVFSPHWSKAAKPSPDMLRSMLPRLNQSGSSPVGQLTIQCHDFGPSNRTKHPSNGVAQGYTCRRKLEERHKSIVLLEAVDESLQNSVHHFRTRAGYRWKKMGADKAVVNHYKYQAWSEFKIKFKRRVSTYVTDWTENVNMMSKDRTPGLGVEAVEPDGWAMKFCEVVDTRLQLLVQKWFGRKVANHPGIKMAWER